jgi:hypothetical protein
MGGFRVVEAVTGGVVQFDIDGRVGGVQRDRRDGDTEAPAIIGVGARMGGDAGAADADELTYATPAKNPFA